MNIGAVLLIVSAMWVASEIALVFSRRSDARSKSQDSGSLIWLNAVIYGSAAVSVYIRFSGVGTIPGVGATLAWVGLVFILLGLAIRWTAVLTLRQYFTVNVAIQPDHRIVRKGLYGFVRHPAYSGTIISFLGLGLALSNWISLAVLLIFIIGAFIRRIQIEERALVLQFGSEYEEYSRTAWRLIPWLY